MRISVRAKRHPMFLEPFNQGSCREIFGPIEGHVLKEMGHALFRVFFSETAYIDVQAQVAAVIGFRVVGPGVTKPIVETAEMDAVINHHVR